MNTNKVLALAAAMLATVSAQKVTAETASVFRGKTDPTNGWIGNLSENNNPWTTTQTTGAVLGFTVFALTWSYVIIYIFYDINKSKNEYAELVEEDRATIRQLNVPKNMLEEWETDLAYKLAGKVKEGRLDDQLFGAAAELPASKYQKFM